MAIIGVATTKAMNPMTPMSLTMIPAAAAPTKYVIEVQR